MSTRSLIGLLSENKKDIKYIYCHFDGYLEGVGNTLATFYKDIEKVKKLIALGDLSILEEKVDPDPNYPHSFDGRYDGSGGCQEDVCLAYGRDRGETGVEAKITTIDEYENLAKGCWVEYIYLYVPGKGWEYNTLSDDGFHTLDEGRFKNATNN